MVDLRHHGDREVAPGMVDFAVNVRVATPPRWLAERLAASVTDLAAYPDPGPARAAVARRHRRDPAEVLLTAGAAEAFVLLARALNPRRAVVVHPQFTEPEAALRAAGHRVDHVVLTGGFTLDPALVPTDADLVVIGNPTNPTSVLHPAKTLAGLARPGRVLVVDEAFADCVPGEAESLAARTDLPGLVVVRSLTKTWGLAGLRVGYLLAAPETVGALAAAQPLWSVSTPALVAADACSSPRALAEADAWAGALGPLRDDLAVRLRELGLTVTPNPRASFVLVNASGADGLRRRLRDEGVAVRRGDTFPGLGPDYVRIAVRDFETNARMTRILAKLL
ncbi:Rv2231c family pyridoxal phosphate-dependent protein CobC [Nocardiopsis ansamitocini]|uniref:Aminotransferase n=1 Tax=Nocardiopsis ansamitocini TaxID=1670832 RepID=A0A9W6UIX9_9ACTN|nr:Rv2231c family pyridoxal phosphate-dependent protein CobC [Nocardiopsis ansamitocini]GLU47913.1 aminotransferase [Nocardiopsis ansamitocini]